MGVYYNKGIRGNNLKFADEILDNMIQVIVEYADEELWKLLKYGTRDSLDKPVVMFPEKIELIRGGSIKKRPYHNDVPASAHNEIRLFLQRWRAVGVDNYEITIGFDVIAHNDIITLVDGSSSTLRIMHSLLNLFNGAEVEKNRGTFEIDGQNGDVSYYNSEYQGYRFYIRGNS